MKTLSEQRAKRLDPPEPSVTRKDLAPGWFPMSILAERHSPDCTCSYCRRFGGTMGVALPKNKAGNAWRILWLRRKGRLHNLRWTLPTVRSLKNMFRHRKPKFTTGDGESKAATDGCSTEGASND